MVYYFEKWVFFYIEKLIVLLFLIVIIDLEGMFRVVLVVCESKIWWNYVKKVKRIKYMFDMKFFLKIININFIIFLCIV